MLWAAVHAHEHEVLDGPIHKGTGEGAHEGGDPAGAAADVEGIAATAERLAMPGAARVRALAGATRGTPAERVRVLRRLLDDGDPAPGPATDPALRLRGQVVLARGHLLVGDAATARRLASEVVAECRARAADGLLAPAAAVLAAAHRHAGAHAEAVAVATEGLRTAEAAGQPGWARHLRSALAGLATLRGDEDPAGTDDVVSRVMRDLGAGRHESVLERLTAVPPGTGLPGWSGLHTVGDLVEAATQAAGPGPGGVEAREWRRRRDRAERAVRPFTEWALATGCPWARAVALRCLAQLAADAHVTPAGNPDGLAETVAALAGTDDVPERAGTDAGRLFERALHLHRYDRDSDGHGAPFEHARTALAYGRWLRRHRRPVRAREHLRTAMTLFDDLGARPWQARAWDELRAAGGREQTPATTSPPDGAAPSLTPREARIVALAARGLSNREIGSRLFLSPRTVGHHLYKAFPKLGVSTRSELAALGYADPAAAA